MKKIFIFILLISSFLQSNAQPKHVIGKWWNGGMGVSLTSTLNHLLYCENNNLIPVMYWHGGAYHNPNGFNGSYNEWEYYFNPVSNLKYNNGDPINYGCAAAGCGNFSYNDLSQEKRNIAYGLIRKYITLNPIVRAKVDQFYNNYMIGKKTIGIHLRGTDKHIEERPVPPEMAIAEALKHADENTQFLVATDDKRLFDRMLELLKGKKVIYYDCYRSDDGKPLHTRNKPSFAQVGEDVAVEIWLMAQCNLLIHTLSSVSAIPLYINPELEHITLKG